MDTQITNLAHSLKRRKCILFAGAGISAALELPDFHTFVDQMAKDLNFHPQLFRGYGDYRTLAEYYDLENGGGLKALFDSLAESWNSPTVPLSRSTIHKTIVELNFPKIYTTNWDHWIEKAHELYGRKYNKVVSIEDLSKEEEGVTSIVKFHGDLATATGFILNEATYIERQRLQSPLDIRLMSDLMECTLLFLGYSMSDPNVRSLLYTISRHKEAATTGSTTMSAYMFFSRPNPVQSRVLRSWGVEAIVPETDDPQEALEDFLIRLKQAVEKG